jgi:protein phosphatase 1 regulatory subunit 7
MSDSDNDQNNQHQQITFADEATLKAAAGLNATTPMPPRPHVILPTQAEKDEATRKAQEEAKGEPLPINTKDQYISIENIRLFYLSDIPLEKLENCTELEVRKNLIHDLVPFPPNMRARLEKLDLFDNKIKHIAPYFSAAGHPLFEDPRWKAKYPDVTDLTFSNLRVLDLSYNQIKHIHGLEALGGTLEELYLVENKIKAIENISHLKKLRLLELGGNQIRAITNKCLQGLSDLEQLWVGKNKIATLEPGCFVHCPKLKMLSLQANRLVDSVPVGVFVPEQLANLEQLHISENGLRTIENIGPLKSIQIMDFSFNPIATLYRPSKKIVAAAVAAAVVEGEKKEETTTTTTTTSSAPAAASSSETTTTTTTTTGEQQQQKETELTIENFPVLEEFWMTDAKLSDWKEISIFSAFSKTLTTIYLERTPLEEDRRYRDKIYQTLPFLTQIDSWPIVNKGNPEADRAIHRR